MKSKYEPAPKESAVLRSEVNEHYKNEFPFQPGDEPIHSAVLGKLLKCVCPDVTGRRLGTRGDSRYYYSGIRRRDQDVPLQFIFENTNYSANANNPASLHTGTNAGVPSVSDQPDLPQSPPPSLPVEPNPIDPKRLPAFVAPTSSELAASFAATYESHCYDILTNAMSPETIQTMDRNFYELLDMEFRELLSENDAIWEAIWRWDACLYDVRLQPFRFSFRMPD